MTDSVPAQPTVTSPGVAPDPPKPSLKSRLKLLFWKLTSLFLLIVLVAAVVLWKPWQANIKAGERTVSVTGTATLKAEPDEFVFNPTYEFTNADRQTALNDLTKKSEEVTAKLKSLGVPSNKIKVNSNNYDIYTPAPNGEPTYNLSLIVTTSTKTLTQTVQDYLLTTKPSGAITPSAVFSSVKQKALESQARDKAEQDARAKADQSAKNLGFKVGNVKAVEDSGFIDYGCSGLICRGTSTLDAAEDTVKSSLIVQPGENELSYSVKISYYIR